MNKIKTTFYYGSKNSDNVWVVLTLTNDANKCNCFCTEYRVFNYR